MLQKYIMIALLLMAITGAYAQQNIEGVVFNASNDEKLEGAHLYLPELEKGNC
ncbi:MAG: hypothetical protein U5L09_00640 [Bacteroidales bacterium]|nr:hypothetical protein [Bacteroidales bacterium]